MSFNTVKTSIQAQHGFTIVELLIVIVIIAILAAVTLLAYGGVSARANSASAATAAEATIKKLEAYTAEFGAYPTTFGLLSTSGTSYYLKGVTFATTAYSTQPATTSTVMLYSCTSNGMVVKYWKYDGTPGVQTLNTGNTTGVCTTLVTS